MATLEEFLKEIAAGASGGFAVQGILESLGIGKRGLDTPAERSYLEGVMDTANIGYEKTGGVTNTYGGIMDGVGARGMDTPAERSAFMEKMNWLQQNPDATQNELQLLGIGARGLNTPAERDFLASVTSGVPLSGDATSSVMQEKMNVLADILRQAGVSENSPEFRDIMLKEMSGVGARGLNTPAERDFLANTMSGGNYEIVGGGITTDKMKFLSSMANDIGLTEGTPEWQEFVYSGGRSGARGAGDYTFGVDGVETSYGFDSPPTQQAIQQMRIDQGITADVGARGMNSATEQAFLQKVMQLDPPQQSTVMQVLSGMTDAQKQNFKMKVITGTVPLEGYEVQNTFGGYGESTPNYGGSSMQNPDQRQQQMLQYNREGNIQNLGFAGY